MLKTSISKLSFDKAIRQSKPFKHFPKGYGSKDNERCIEIEFIRHSYDGEDKVLDVGYAFAEPRWFDMIQTLQIPNLIGIDLTPPGSLTGYQKTVRGDIRRTNFKDNTFDSIFCVSILEHVGMDNTMYKTATENNPYSQLDAMKEMYRILKPGGKLLLTLPFGKYHNHQTFIHYDLASLRHIIVDSNFETCSIETYQVKKYWEFCPVSDCANNPYKGSVYGSGSVVCLCLKKSL